MSTILWILAGIIVLTGAIALVRRQVLWGGMLIAVGILIGPDGVRLFV